MGKKWIEGLKIWNLGLKVEGSNLLLVYGEEKLKGEDGELFKRGGVGVGMGKELSFRIGLGI